MDMLRLITAGSVDDGKSTLIGRLLYDNNAILDDQLDALRVASEKRGEGTLDLALLTDGLRAEREQGITIDVAYRYFSTPQRKFIIADTPGHIQYTRNMVTGASNCNLAIILVDARHGVVEQTRRHSLICALMGIPHVVLCINKMDLVEFSETVFQKIVEDYQAFAAKLTLGDLHFIPISALKGNNVVDHCDDMPWYQGPALLQLLNEIEIAADTNLHLGRFQVQWVIRPQTPELPDYRGYAGKILSGTYRPGDQVVVWPTGIPSTIKAIEVDQQEVTEAWAPLSVVMHLADDIDVGRGSTIAATQNPPALSQDIQAYLCWMDSKPLRPGNRYLLQHHSNQVKCIVKELTYRIDINTSQQIEGEDLLNLNDIGEVVIRTATPLAVDTYSRNRANGGFILIDESTHNTVAAGMITQVNHPQNVVDETQFYAI